MQILEIKITKKYARACICRKKVVPLCPIFNLRKCAHAHKYMQISDLEILFAQHPEIRVLQREVSKGRDTHVLVSGLYASARALALSALTREPLFIVMDNAEAAQYMYSDLKVLLQPSAISNQPSDVKGIVLNAGGYSHTSVALRDAVEESLVPVVEVHISDITRREPFRQISLLTDVCAHSIIGKGTDGYLLATEWLLNNNTKTIIT